MAHDNDNRDVAITAQNELAFLVAGVDEAGRGCLAGPVVAAAVILDPRREIRGLADSKILSPQKRETLAFLIKERALAWAVAEATIDEIDALNILQASLLAMKRAVEALPVRPHKALIDGNKCPLLSIPTKAIIRGDALIAAISAGSILAKVERDRIITRLAADHPGYRWERNKGYGTAEHLDALARLGPTLHHRRSFKPVSEL